ncbi:MAG TPA: PspA/IM30 family protein [Longimicrobiales bacterium]|nr:PspA/IM30 family protein [Longimicrobiales bacterium]
MGIFQKLSTLIRSNINDAIARAENPEKMLTQIIADMREQLARAKQEVAVAIADERKLRSQVEEELKQAHDWEARAVLAVRENRDDLAKQALLRQQEHAERAASLEETWRRQAMETEKLKASLQQLNDKIEEAKRKKNLLIARQKRAIAQKRIHETMAGLNDRSAFEAFERMAERIEESERRSLAAAEVQATLTGDHLEREFERLQGQDRLDQKLLELKKQLGLPAPDSGESGSLPGGTTGAKRLRPAHVGDGEAGVRDAEIEEG